MSILSVSLRADSILRCNSLSQARPLWSDVCEEWLQSSWRKCLRRREQQWAPLLSVCSARPTLDDVERLTRGRASKAKIGSRAVPHRLNMDERRAYELAKRRGFVVHQPNTRLYPLINSHRNYCDALGIPCIRIDQGLGGQADEVVMDLTPLPLSEVDLQTFREVVIKAVEALLSQNDQTWTPSEGPGMQQTSDTEDSLAPSDVRIEDGGPKLTALDASVSIEEKSGDSEPLRFQASSRSEAKAIAQTGVDTWKSWSRTNLTVVV